MMSSRTMSDRSFGATVVLVTALIAVSGCATTSGTGAADAEPPEMTDAMMSDLSTERTVLRALFDEPSLSGQNILVSCVNGNVTLFGTVESANKSELAERVVRGLDGVDSLVNSIVVN